VQAGYIPAIIGADARSLPIASESVQCVATSPPYWGLRSYAGEQDSVWGGSEACSHEWGPAKKIKQSPQRDHARGGAFAKSRGKESARKGMSFEASQGCFCKRCEAWKGSFGMEPTPELYVQHSVEILRQIKLTLRPDGIVFWNVDDTRRNAKLALVPQRLSIALQDDGWFIRSIIPWIKTNPMPESVRNRPTDCWEHILMLTKSRKYFWNAESCREVASSRDAGPDGKRNMRNVWTFSTQPYKGAHFAAFPEEFARRCIELGSRPGDLVLDPFGGSGTTAKVAHELGRRCVLIDRNYSGHDGYERLVRERLSMESAGSRPLRNPNEVLDRRAK
jgi:DNA modification methylase